MLADRAASEELEEDQDVIYRSIIGSLMYIVTRARPDVLVVTSMKASHLQKPVKSHIWAAMGALRCLNGTKNRKFNLKPGEDSPLTMFVDASWAKLFEKDRRSRFGMLVNLGCVVISFTTNIPTFVSLNSSEVVYVTSRNAVRTVVWLRNVLE